MNFWLFLPRRSTMHITVGKLWEENKINLAENTTQPEEEKHFDPNLKKKKTLNKQNNQGQKFSFGWKHSTRSEVILSLQLSSISEGQLIRIELLETIFILENLEIKMTCHTYRTILCMGRRILFNALFVDKNNIFAQKNKRKAV